MRVDVITVFPDYLAPLELSLIGKARQRGLLDVRVHDLRTWTDDVHRTVDDKPYGGGPGMVMTPEPWRRALAAVAPPDGPAPVLVVPSPSGAPFIQRTAAELAGEPWLVFGCGRYEGIDARVVEHARRRMPVREISLGDYVLAGGEVAVLVVVEAVARLLPGVLGNTESAVDDSFSAGLLEAPAYTRPPRWEGLDVPGVLLSGDHAAVARWRRDESLRRTARRRPDLLEVAAGELTDRDRAVLAEEEPEITGREDGSPGVAE
ncbi:MAG: tRNA (guanosine(37)-N1)-methyltransferase TrmD [Actinomycetota bacterium]|nr:tRNA (guanosine(37)-N1)-methyltransferase TrmD [Actinomycetota bacterium]